MFDSYDTRFTFMYTIKNIFFAIFVLSRRICTTLILVNLLSIIDLHLLLFVNFMKPGLFNLFGLN